MIVLKRAAIAVLLVATSGTRSRMLVAAADVRLEIQQDFAAAEIDGAADNDANSAMRRTAEASITGVPIDINDDDIESITVSGALQGLSSDPNVVSEEEDAIVYSKLRSYTQSDNDVVSIWEGAVMGVGDTGFATFLLQPSTGQLTAGTFTTAIATYSLTTLADDGRVIVEATLWSEQLEDETMVNVANPLLFQIPEYQQLLQAKEEEEAKAVKSETNSGPIESMATSAPRDIRDVLSGSNSASLLFAGGGTAEIDVVFVITNQAMCAKAFQQLGCSADDYSSPIESALQVAIAEANTALQVSGVNAELRIVGYHHDKTGYDMAVTDEALLNLIIPFDGQLDYVEQLRRNTGADLACLITRARAYGEAGGKAFPGPYSVTSYTALSSYILAHEIGHSIFCDHNPEDSDFFSALSGIAWWYGWRNPGNFRTIMAYNCRDDGLLSCRPIPFFSTSDTSLTYNGLPLGDATHDNARQLKLFAPVVSSFMNPCPCTQGNWLCRLFWACCSDCTID